MDSDSLQPKEAAQYDQHRATTQSDNEDSDYNHDVIPNDVHDGNTIATSRRKRRRLGDAPGDDDVDQINEEEEFVALPEEDEDETGKLALWLGKRVSSLT